MKRIVMRTEKFENLPLGGIQVFNPKYRDCDLNDAIEESQVLTEYVPFGYNMFLFCKELGTIFCYKQPLTFKH